METPEAKFLVKQIRKLDPAIVNVEYNMLRDLVPVASGNFGSVLCGYYKRRQVAVKRLLDVADSEMHKYLFREIETLKHNPHPNIVEFIGVCEHSSGLYIVTEYISGGDLRKLLKNPDIQLTWETRISLATHICSALVFLHTKQIVHRDIKSHNILITDSGVAKICDFGFSRKLPKKKNSRILSLCGTDEWMAPEILMDYPYDEKADVYSFAMLLTELVTRKKPLERHAHDCFAFDVDGFRSRCPRDTPSTLVNLIIRCSNLTPSKRPEMQEVLESLETLGLSRNNIVLPKDNIKPTQGKIVTAIKAYKAKDSVELNVKKGDRITIIQTDESNWCEGIINLQRGWFPLYIVGSEESKNKAVDDGSINALENRSVANKQLMNFLSTRPNEKDLEDRNILPPSPLQSNEQKLEKKHKIETLSKFFRKKISRKDSAPTNINSMKENILDKLIVQLYCTLPITINKKKHEVYDCCFSGLTLIEWIIREGYSNDISGARQIGNMLIKRRIIVPITESQELKEKGLYQLKLHQESLDISAINNIKSWNQESRNPQIVISHLIQRFSSYIANPSKQLSLSIDIATSELQRVDLSLLSNKEERIIFFINLYNFMINYLVSRYGEPENEYVKNEMHNTKAFQVGTSLFSLNDIKTLILFPIKEMHPDDPRNFLLCNAEPILICLLCDPGSQSMPLIAYEPDTFEVDYSRYMQDFFISSFIVSENMITFPHCVQEYANAFENGDIIKTLNQLQDLLPLDVNERVSTAKDQTIHKSDSVIYFV